MKTKEQQLKEAKADRDKAWADFEKANTNWKQLEEKSKADWVKAWDDYWEAYDRIQELEKQ